MRPTQESYERDPQKRPAKEQSPRTDRNLMSLSTDTNITHQQTRNTTTTKVTPKKYLPNRTTIEQPGEISVLPVLTFKICKRDLSKRQCMKRDIHKRPTQMHVCLRKLRDAGKCIHASKYSRWIGGFGSEYSEWVLWQFSSTKKNMFQKRHTKKDQHINMYVFGNGGMREYVCMHSNIQD